MPPASHHNTPSMPPLFQHHSHSTGVAAFQMDRSHLYDHFEANLARRLSLLLPYDDSSSCVTMASLQQAMEILLQADTDLQELSPPGLKNLFSTHSKMMQDFLERSVKFLDACRAIKAQILFVQSLQGMLGVIVSCSESSLGFCAVNRLIKVLEKLMPSFERKIGEENTVRGHHLSRSFRYKPSESSQNYDLRAMRGRSWHGNVGMVAMTAHNNSGNSSSHGHSQKFQDPFKELQSLGAMIAPPRTHSGYVEDFYLAATYAVNSVSVFFLSAIAAALPGLHSRAFVVALGYPQSFMWASPLSVLQEKIQEELHHRSKCGSGYAGLLELDQMASNVRKLSLMANPPEHINKEEIRRLGRMVKSDAEKLESGLDCLYKQVTELSNRIISIRMAVLDVLSCHGVQ